jgi:uncharacterized damage-inducible protein DinB
MAIAQSLLPEFDHEMRSTRTLLERVPADHASWKPHEKSYALGSLALHVAQLPMWAGMTMQTAEFDMASPQARDDRSFQGTDTLLATFDANVATARAAIEAAGDAEFMSSWTLKAGDQEIFSMPRVAVLRSFVMNHLIHHRGQLTVYLRMKNVPLPEIYGPTADSAA